MNIVLGRSLRALVVDDNYDAVASMKELLELGCACEARGCTDGLSCLSLADSFHPDVIFLDIAMPGMNGFAILDQIRSRAQPQAMVVALTGYAHDAMRSRATAAGFAHYEAKPINFSRLCELVEEAVQKASLKYSRN